MTYTLTFSPGVVVRDEDGAFIPFDPDNMDYQAYLAWLDKGNKPTPSTQPAPPTETQPAPEGEDHGASTEAGHPARTADWDEYTRPAQSQPRPIPPKPIPPEPSERPRPAAPTKHGPSGRSKGPRR